jgi:SMC interacting uncharacterized protein involved in chromosome segregation
MVASGSLHIFELQDYLQLCCFTMSQQKASRFHRGSASTPVVRQIQGSIKKEEKDIHAAMVDIINTPSSHNSTVEEKIKNLEDLVSFWKTESEHYSGQASYYRKKLEKTKEKLQEARKKLQKTDEFRGWWPDIAEDEDDD